MESIDEYVTAAGAAWGAVLLAAQIIATILMVVNEVKNFVG